jgi:hypothetical protein
MASRKSLVDLLSEIAPSHIDKLGERTADSRWYLVRNVVAILGSTHSPAVLHYLGRTLRHADARVRRETIRGVASIRDRMADEMLMAALSDDSPQNVSLAARSLGTIGSRDATPALGAVARGEGRGARDTTVRLEAIEALARIGTTEAHSVIAALARHRGMLRGGRTREIQAAAEAAAARISRAREGGGAR